MKTPDNSEDAYSGIIETEECFNIYQEVWRYGDVLGKVFVYLWTISVLEPVCQ